MLMPVFRSAISAVVEPVETTVSGFTVALTGVALAASPGTKQNCGAGRAGPGKAVGRASRALEWVTRVREP